MISIPKTSLSAIDYLYPLTAMSASANAAWSTRKLRSAYAGYAVKVRRDSDNATTDVSFSTYDMIASGSSVSAGGDLITWAAGANLFIDTWYDQSTNTRNATQVITASQPQLILDGGSANNYRPVMRCSGAQYLSVPSPISGPSSLTLAVIAGNITNRAVVNRIFNTHRNADNAQLFQFTFGTDERIRWTCANTGGTSILNLAAQGSIVGANFSQFTIVVDNSALVTVTATSYEKGTQIQTLTSAVPWANTTVANDYQIFANSGLASFYIGDLSELVYFTSVLSAGDQSILNKSQRGFFNLT